MPDFSHEKEGQGCFELGISHLMGIFYANPSFLALQGAVNTLFPRRTPSNEGRVMVTVAQG